MVRISVLPSHSGQCHALCGGGKIENPVREATKGTRFEFDREEICLC